MARVTRPANCKAGVRTQALGPQKLLIQKVRSVSPPPAWFEASSPAALYSVTALPLGVSSGPQLHSRNRRGKIVGTCAVSL